MADSVKTGELDHRLPLHTKYRPNKWDDIIGNRAMLESLRSTLNRKDARPHAILLVGPSGCGKTTIARIIGNVLDCSSLDFNEYNAAQARGIDVVREIQMSMLYPPLSGKCKIYLLDEAARLTTDAQSALLKMLEDTPSHVFFILCTTDPEKLLKTIKTRCATHSVSALTPPELFDLLYKVCVSEGIPDFPKEALTEIARVSDGSARQALVILDKVIDMQDDRLLFQAIEESTVKEVVVIDICRAIMAKNWPQLCAMLSRVEKDKVEDTRYAILGYFRSILINPKSGNNHEFASMVIGNFLESFMYSGAAGLARACFESVKMGNMGNTRGR